MKFSLRLIIAAFALTFSTEKIFSQCVLPPNIFTNPSFEGTPQPHVTPSGWSICEPGQTPDTQPGSWGVNLPPTNGSSYLGLVAQPSTGWQEGASEQLPTPLVAGRTYTFTVDLANIFTSDPGVGIIPGCAELEVWGGFGPCDHISVLWASGNITPYDTWMTYTITLLPTQNYTWITFRIHSLGCTDGPYIIVDNITPILPNNLTPVPNAVAATCFGFNTGSAYIGYTGGQAPYSFQWSNGVTTQNNPNLFAGTYGVTITDANLCTATTNVTITESPDILASVSVVDATCGSLNGSLTANITSGTGPFSFLWSNQGNTQTIPNLSQGTYSLTITGAGGCINSTPISGTVNSTGGLTLSPSFINASCGSNNGSATVDVTAGTGPFTYLWSNQGNTQTILNLSQGTYEVTVTGAAGCTATASTIVNSTGGPVLAASATDATCYSNDGTATVSIASGTGPYTYIWTNGDTTQTTSNLIAGTYSVTVTGFGGCATIASATVNSTGAPVLSPSVNNATCNRNNGSASVTITSGTGPYTYAWNNGGTTQTISNVTDGTYTVTVTSLGGCTATASAVVSTTDIPVITSSSVNAICNNNNGSATVSITSGTGPYTYVWNNGDTTQTTLNIAGGTYTVTVTGFGGCTATSTATVNATGSPVLSSSATNTTCAGNTGSATVTIISGTGPYTYVWNNGDTTPTTSNLIAGTYTVTVTGNLGCSATSGVSVAASSNVVFSVAATHTSCGLNNGSLSVNVTTGTSPFGYLWTGGNTTSTVSNLASGSYVVTVTDANGCSASASTAVNPSSSITVGITANNTVICKGDTAQLCAPAGYVSYLWNTGETTSCINTQATGNYYTTVTDQGNCRATSNHIAITVRPAPNVSITVHGDSMTVFNETVIQWYLNGNAIPGATSQVYIANTSGNYSVAVRDTVGCSVVSTGISIQTTGIDGLFADRVIVYPNPLAAGNWQLNVSETWMGSVCEIYDAEGRLVYKSIVSNAESEISYEPARGVYLMRILSDDKSLTFKLIKL